MPKLRKISGKECVKILCNKFDFKVVRQRGSHIILKKETKEGTVGTVVPNHKELKIGTLKGVLKLGKVDEDDVPFLAVALVVLLVFMLLWGFVASTKEGGLELHKGIKIGLFVVIAIAVVIAVIVATGQWDLVVNSLFKQGAPTDLASTILLVALIGGALAVVLSSGKSGDK